MIQYLLDAWSRWQANRRKIFFYRVGRTRRRVDPLAVNLRLETADRGWEKKLEVIGHRVPDLAGEELKRLAEESRKEAIADVVKAARAAFDLPELDNDGHGATDAEVIGVLAAYVRFMMGLAASAQVFTSPGVPATIPAAG